MSPRKYTEARKENNKKWDAANLDRMSVAAPQGTKERWKEAAADRGKSLNQFIFDTVEAEINNKAGDILEYEGGDNVKTYYHGTFPKNYASIICNGINASKDGFVYLTDSIENAARFVAFNSDETGDFDVIVFSVKIRKKDETKIFESADHNEKFWGCKAWVYDGSIPKEMLGSCYKVYFEAKAGE